MPRLPADALETFMGLGPERTYQKLASRLGVSKRSVVRRAKSERWQSRMAAIAVQARVKTDANISDAIADVNERHLRTMRLIQAKALQGLSTLTLRTGMDCVRALDVSVKAERTVLGKDEPDRGPTLAEVLGRVQASAMERPR